MNTIPAALIAGMLPCAAKSDVRYYLNGVFFEPRNGKAIAVSTDGRVMCVAHTSMNWDLGAIIIPRDVCEQLAKMKGEIVFSAIDDGRRFKASNGPSTIKFVAIDGRFPEWRAVVPDLDEQAPVAFAVGVLEQVVKSAQAFAKGFGSKKYSGVVLRPVGERAMLAGIAGIYDGDGIERVNYVVMPMRDTGPIDHILNPEATRA